MLLQDPKNEADDLDDFTEPNNVDCEPLVDSSSSLIFTKKILVTFSYFIFWPQFHKQIGPDCFPLSGGTHSRHSSMPALVLFMKGPLLCCLINVAVFQMAAAS